MPKAVKARDAYLKRVRAALETSATEMSRSDYIDALEEIQCDVEARLDAARQESGDS
jgi:hypothetical protein